MTQTQNPDLTPVAVLEPTDFGFTVWFDFPNAGVDRPRTYGMSVTKRNAPRLMRAVNAGAVTLNAHVATSNSGQTYVSFTSAVYARYINVDLKKLGY